MHVRALGLVDFRCYTSVDIELPPGVTVVQGANGQGKTSLLEAIAWAATVGSFRAVPDRALVRAGCATAVIHVDVDADSRAMRIDAELRATGRNRILVNRHALARARDLLGVLRVSVFSPDDLQLVKGGPSERRRYLDELLVSLAPRYEAARADFERVLRHRNALLRGGVRDADARTTLDVFDEQLVRSGGELLRGRLRLVARLAPALDASYRAIAGAADAVTTAYEADWADGPLPAVEDGPGTPGPARDAGLEDALRAALQERRRREIERGTTLVGPHRDEWRLEIAGLDSRVQASQGEQRSLALALRLAGHRVSAETTGTQPVLLLDDVFSELDGDRARRLVEHLPQGQAVVTTAGAAPPDVVPDLVLEALDGSVLTR